MTTALHEELTDAVFRAALESDAWDDVMRLMKRRFPSSAQTFYFLDLEPHLARPVCVMGIEPRWLDSFNAFYFAPDNPWIRLTRQLHRPGVVRTNERLGQLLRDPDALYRSSYYNDWMRPQGLKYTIGNTLLTDGGTVANITLLRSPDTATFDAEEVAAFEAVSRQLTQALQMSIRLEKAEFGLGSGRAFDSLPQAVALIDSQRHLIYANRAMESLLQTRRGLSLREGRLHALRPQDEERLTACVADALASLAGGTDEHAASLNLRYDDGAHVVVHAVPVAGAAKRFLPSAPMVLLMAANFVGEQTASCDELRRLYGYTKSEARLAQLVVRECGLRQAARAMGVTYGTARVYLKVVFEKAGVHSQAQLVARILRDTRS
jgi:PAS domain-containing protein/DNA-binding CsgD family transcriptional regulator